MHKHKRFISSDRLQEELHLERTSTWYRGHGRHRLKPEHEGSNIIEIRRDSWQPFDIPEGESTIHVMPGMTGIIGQFASGASYEDILNSVAMNTSGMASPTLNQCSRCWECT